MQSVLSLMSFISFPSSFTILYLFNNSSELLENFSSSCFDMYIWNLSLIFAISSVVAYINSLTTISAGEYLDISSKAIEKLFVSFICVAFKSPVETSHILIPKYIPFLYIAII